MIYDHEAVFFIFYENKKFLGPLSKTPVKHASRSNQRNRHNLLGIPDYCIFRYTIAFEPLHATNTDTNNSVGLAVATGLYECSQGSSVLYLFLGSRNFFIFLACSWYIYELGSLQSIYRNI